MFQSKPRRLVSTILLNCVSQLQQNGLLNFNGYQQLIGIKVAIAVLDQQLLSRVELAGVESGTAY